MNWAETIVQALKDWNTSLIAYVPDISIHQVTSLIDDDPLPLSEYLHRLMEIGKLGAGSKASRLTPILYQKCLFLKGRGARRCASTESAKILRGL